MSHFILECAKSEKNGEITVLTPIGRVDTSTAKAFEDSVMAAAKTDKKIIISFNSIDYISSAGLRVVLVLGKQLGASGGLLALINMPEKIFAVFKMSGFDKILKIYSTFDEAKSFFN